jgi:hypothetical protein
MPGNVPAWALTELAGGDERVIAELANAGLIAPFYGDIGSELYCIHPLTRAHALDNQDRTSDDGNTGARSQIRAG